MSLYLYFCFSLIPCFGSAFCLNKGLVFVIPFPPVISFTQPSTLELRYWYHVKEWNEHLYSFVHLMHALSFTVYKDVHIILCVYSQLSPPFSLFCFLSYRVKSWVGNCATSTQCLGQFGPDWTYSCRSYSNPNTSVILMSCLWRSTLMNNYFSKENHTKHCPYIYIYVCGSFLL